ncbi:MAG: hypothetical protein IKI57_02240 [Clostridia bacterium]|nr:hypothetical protein [Clostridia bacterium]
MGYYAGDFDRFLESPYAIIGPRESGKTTILKRVLSLAYEQGYTIAVFDSCTDHKEKSILIHAKENYPDAVYIPSPEKKEILNMYAIPDFKKGFYPTSIIDKKHDKRIFLFDVAKYLEEGYDTEDLEERARIRLYYRCLVRQELYAFAYYMLSKKILIIMDEIELLDTMFEIINTLYHNNKPILLALHSEVALSGLKPFFEVMHLGE